MESCKVISVGAKLKLLREKYKLRQDQIVGKAVTRNLISEIEHGKAKLTRNTAEIIISNVKEILSKINLDLDVDVEYLVEDEETQAKKILDQYIEELRELLRAKDDKFLMVLRAAEEFLMEWDFIDKKIDICHIAGDYFSDNKDFYKASIYYENVRCLMNVSMDTEPLIAVLKKLSITYFCMGRYGNAIDVCSYALNQFPKMDNECRIIFLYNTSLYYNYLKEYEKALNIIERLENIISTFSKDEYEKVYDRILLLKASCLQGVKRYEEAFKVYNCLLEVTPKEEQGNRSIYLCNMSEMCFELNNIGELKKYINIILDNLNDINENFIFLPQLYYELGKRYREIKEYKRAHDYLKKAMSYAKSFKYFFVIKDILMELINHPYEEMDINIKEEFINQVKNVGGVNNVLMVSVIQYYTELKNTEAISEICILCKKYYNYYV